MDLINRIGGLIAVVSDPRALLDALGPWLLVGVALIVFVESGVLFPFLPGDSLLVAAAVVHGALGAQLWRIVAVCLLAAVAGDQAGYWLGARYGRRLFRDDARILRTDRLEEAEALLGELSRLSSAPASAEAERLLRDIRALARDLPADEADKKFR